MKKHFVLILIVAFFSLTSCLKTKEFNPDDFKFTNLEVTFDGNNHEILLAGTLDASMSVEYENNSATEVGSYLAKAHLYQGETLLHTYEAYLLIKPDLSELFFPSVSITEDMTPYEAKLSKNIEDLYDVVYTSNLLDAPGKYYSKASVYDKNTHVLVDEFFAIHEVDVKRNQEFDALLDEIFVSLFENDQLTINFMFNDYKAFNLTHQEAKYEVYEKIVDVELEKEEILDLIRRVNSFNHLDLSSEQDDCRSILNGYLEYVLSYYENPDFLYMTNDFFGTYLGLSTNLPLELSEYKFREEQDIIDFISYLNSTEDAFISYVEFSKEQAEAGYAMPDFVIDNVVSFCEDFANLGQENYLIEIFNQKIDAISFELTKNTKEEYKMLAYNAIIGPLSNAYKYASTNLLLLKNQATVYGGLAMHGSLGKQMYVNMLEYVLGYDIEPQTLLLSDEYNEIYLEIVSLVEEVSAIGLYEEFISALMNPLPIKYSNLLYDELLDEFKIQSESFVPKIDEMPEVSINLVPDALKHNFSPAAYIISALDEKALESIYLNPLYTNDYNYIFTTLAHEGYPGHLYQNVYAKSLDIHVIRHAIKCSGYMEGWATYAEFKSFDFVKNYDSEVLQYVLKYIKLNQELNLVINTICDILIHYNGLTLEEFSTSLAAYIGDYLDIEAVRKIYEQIIEIPTNMSMYGFSYLILKNLKNYAMVRLGDDFDEVAFHKVILDVGAAPLNIVEDKVYEYIEKTIYELTGSIISINP